MTLYLQCAQTLFCPLSLKHTLYKAYTDTHFFHLLHTSCNTLAYSCTMRSETHGHLFICKIHALYNALKHANVRSYLKRIRCTMRGCPFVYEELSKGQHVCLSYNSWHTSVWNIDYPILNETSRNRSDH